MTEGRVRWRGESEGGRGGEERVREVRGRCGGGESGEMEGEAERKE